MTYREILPPEPLRPFVDRFWLRTRDGTADVGGGTDRILPDGCMDVIVEVDSGRADVVGTMTRALLSPATTGDLAAVRFKPGAAASLLGVAANELTDRSVPLELVGRNGLELGSVAGGSVERALSGLRTWVTKRAASAPGLDRAVLYAVGRLLEPTPPAAHALAEELGWSRQHLRRRMLVQVGTSPKTLSRVLRLQRAVAHLQRFSQRDLARAALDLGYFDQAHMSRDFRLLAGLSPTQARRQSGSIFPIRSLFLDIPSGS